MHVLIAQIRQFVGQDLQNVQTRMRSPADHGLGSITSKRRRYDRKGLRSDAKLVQLPRSARQLQRAN